jgi:hypothetical protein
MCQSRSKDREQRRRGDRTAVELFRCKAFQMQGFSDASRMQSSAREPKQYRSRDASTLPRPQPWFMVTTGGRVLKEIIRKFDM